MTKSFKVLKIDELVRQRELGGVERYSRITFKTTMGVVRTIDVDDVDMTPEKAAPILEKKAAEIDGIMKL